MTFCQPTHGLLNCIYFDQCSQSFRKRLLQTLALTPHSDSQPYVEIVPSTFCPFANHKRLNSARGARQKTVTMPSPGLLSLIVPPELPNQTLLDFIVSGGKHSRHREEGVLRMQHLISSRAPQLILYQLNTSQEIQVIQRQGTLAYL